MAVTPLPSSHASDLLTDALELMRSLTARDWSVSDDHELAEAVRCAEHLRSLLHVVQADLLCELDHRGAPRSWGWGSTAEWFTHLAGLRVGQGRRLVAQALELVRERSATRSALIAGDLSPDQAGIVLDAVDDLPEEQAVRQDAEAVLIERAGGLHATDLARVATSVLDVVDPDLGARRREAARDRLARAAHLRRFLTISEDGAGGVRIRGRGSIEDAAVLRTALLPLTAPVGSIDAETGQRMTDPRDHGVRMWDALVRVTQHALDTAAVPDSHGCTPRVSVLTDLDTLIAGAGADATTDDGMRMGPGTVRRLACDAHVVPVVLGSESEVLDVGREARLVTPALWRALVARDRGCAFPSCGKPPVMCHAHHIVHWADGGSTALDNLVLMCGHHHRTVHDSPWQVRLRSDDQRPEFLPPSDDPGEQWVRERPRRE